MLSHDVAMTTPSLARNYPTREDARAFGRAARETAPRRALANLTPTDRDPVEHLIEQNADRVQDLIPLRMARMLQNPFAFYRGTAGLMALDLSDDANSGIQVICCGDAHISNFGFYASPERRLVFDLNDFDEAAAAPWEWDLKRLVASAIIGGRHAGYEAAHIAGTAREAVSQLHLHPRQAQQALAGGSLLHALGRTLCAAAPRQGGAAGAGCRGESRREAHGASARSSAPPSAGPTASSASSTTRRR